MSPDIIARIGDSVIQHGPLSSRVYLMSLAPDDCPAIIPEMEKLARTKGYTKIFAKIPQTQAPLFKEAGYITEANIPGFFRGRQGAAFMALYLDENRGRPTERSLLSKVLAISRSKGKTAPKSCCPREYQISRMSVSDIHDMAGLYSRVFESYPFPIFDPDYLAQTMENKVMYFGVRHKGRLIGLGSAETDMDALNAEMTDFATLADYRGRGLAGILLDLMTRESRKMGILTQYTIARAGSFGMNITFARAGYEFAGTLLNNTHIAGQLESMNVWYNPGTKQDG
ncbi:MAG: putative beta-lysine N-acetyltransferase [Desulfonatronovibrio sp.]